MKFYNLGDKTFETDFSTTFASTVVSVPNLQADEVFLTS